MPWYRKYRTLCQYCWLYAHLHYSKDRHAWFSLVFHYQRSQTSTHLVLEWRLQEILTSQGRMRIFLYRTDMFRTVSQFESIYSRNYNGFSVRPKSYRKLKGIIYLAKVILTRHSSENAGTKDRSFNQSYKTGNSECHASLEQLKTGHIIQALQLVDQLCKL